MLIYAKLLNSQTTYLRPAPLSLSFSLPSSLSPSLSLSFSSKTKGFEKEERLVYQIIEDSGNKGIWIREIRIKSNLPQQQIVKTLKTLESKKLIKSVKSVQQGLKKKVYMLADLAPDESVTGGAWYSDQDFESEFVEVLNQQCLKYLQHKVSLCIAAQW